MDHSWKLYMNLQLTSLKTSKVLINANKNQPWPQSFPSGKRWCQVCGRIPPPVSFSSQSFLLSWREDLLKSFDRPRCSGKWVYNLSYSTNFLGVIIFKLWNIFSSNGTQQLTPGMQSRCITADSVQVKGFCFLFLCPSPFHNGFTP